MKEEVKVEAEEEHGLTAKGASLHAMIISVAWVMVLSITKAVWGLFSSVQFGLDIYEIILSGAVIMGFFAPVYASIILDKVKDIRWGK